MSHETVTLKCPFVEQHMSIINEDDFEKQDNPEGCAVMYKDKNAVRINEDPEIWVTTSKYTNEVEVDKNIADLISLMWACGIRTSASCESDIDSKKDMNDKIWIQFYRVKDYLKFMNMIGSSKDVRNKEDQNFILFMGDFGHDINCKKIKEEDSFVHRYNLCQKGVQFDDVVANPEEFPGEYNPGFSVNVNLYFPKKYKTMIMKKLTRHVKHKYSHNLYLGN